MRNFAGTTRQQPDDRYRHRQHSETRRGKDTWQFTQTRFFCEACGKSYKWKESLLKHKRVECGKLPQFSCEVCGYRFMHKHHLVKHLTSVHRMTPLNGAAMLVFQ
ncbi:Longitudinals lacking protein, isoforms A/B/D/L [Anthophora retusa]